MKWEYLRVSVHHKEEGKVDFVAKRDNELPSIATHDTLEAHFNVQQKDWDTFLQRLKTEGWELEKIDHREKEQSAAYHFKRAKE